MTSPPAIIEASAAVLLDFDGPVCAVFGGLPDHEVAAELRDLFDGDLPAAVNQSRDPFDVLKYATSHGDLAADVERRLRELEVRAVEVAPPTPGTSEVLDTLWARGMPVVIVSNNSTAAVSTYLQVHRMGHTVVGISARSGPNVNQLKPHPYLIQEAIGLLDVRADGCVMIGDSTSDIEAGQRAGTSVIAYANKPGKRERFEPLAPTAIIERMRELI
ncbi:HAD family hydrolase [Saccharopolyspora erythraea]|uniref:HAD family hydrolase n=1 Tax=Saccharopolyspora erythraea TaxID=1836 RepID=UPI001BA53F16|nr:HAD-IA family hydrolase [Saccharopolyspora erythraea]QUH05398.1 HAD family hydrolase [Saccharopolyspora erythraea]